MNGDPSRIHSEIIKSHQKAGFIKEVMQLGDPLLLHVPRSAVVFRHETVHM